MKVVYLVLVHRAPEHVRALQRLLSELGEVHVHVDAKVDCAPFMLDSIGIRYVPERTSVSWGGWSIVDATLLLMYSASPGLNDDDFVALLSGDSYLLQHPSAVCEYLRTGGDRQYINCVSMPSAVVEKPITRLSRYYIEFDRHDGKHHGLARTVNKLALPRNYQKALGRRRPFCGSQWWTLTGAAVKWLLREIEADSPLVQFARNTRVPDEWFFQTLLMDSPFRNEIVRSLMFADFTRSNPPWPAGFDHSHVRMLKGAPNMACEHRGYGIGPVLFARKFPADSAELRAAVEDVLWPRAIVAR